MKASRKNLLIGGCLLLFAAIALFKLRNTGATPAAPGGERARTAAVAAVHRGTLSNVLTLSGELHPFQEVDVHSKVAGFLKTISVDVGDHVRAGQVIAVLEIPELNAALQGADASVHHAQDSINRARSEMERMKSAHNASHFAYTRLKQAADARKGLIAEQELDEAEAKDKGSEAQIETAAASLAEAQSQLVMAEASQRQATALSGYSNITVPFNGVITRRYADTGSLIQAGTSSNTQAMPVVRVAEVDRLRLVLPVPESAVRNVQLGTKVHIRVPALGRIFEGTVARYADALDPETRTMHTEIDVKNPDNTLVNGMYAEADLVLGRKESVLTLPVQAVARNGREATVLLVNTQNRLEPRNVKLGIESADRVEILEGLADKDLVLIGGGGQFRAGDTVTPKVSEATSTAEEAQP